MNKNTGTSYDTELDEYFKNHPDHIHIYIDEIFDAYAEDSNIAALLSGLRVVARVSGIQNIANQTGMTRQGVQHALSAKGNPNLDNINAIMNSLGYALKPYPIDHGRHA